MSMAGPNALRPSVGCLSRASSPLKLSTLHPSPTRIAAFSTTARQCKRKTKDNNKKRGVSSLYGSGPRENLSMSDVPLPKPRQFKRQLPVDENHGLWGFFPAPGKLMWTPGETEEHGRAWTVEELRKKSWEDLHSLWWVCCRERNMLATSKAELARAKLGFGEQEFVSRDQEVQKTMRSVKHALTERFYTWQDAVEMADSDPEIDLKAPDGKVFKPSAYEDGLGAQESWEELDEDKDGSGSAAGEGLVEKPAEKPAEKEEMAR